MIIKSWPQGVNDRFYAFNKTPKDNTQVTEYLSGRVAGRLINSRHLFKISASLRLRVADELPAFWEWYTEELGALSCGFTCPHLEGKYRFTATPQENDTGRVYRNISVELEEVY